MMIARWMRLATLPMAAALALALPAASASAQGVTTSAINARVLDANGQPRANARVFAIHVPSGTHYEGRTRADGRVTLPGMRVGGPYRVTATALGSEPDVRDSVYLGLGVATDIVFTLRTAAVQLSEVTITGQTETVFSSDRTGAATSVPRDVIATLPTITRRIEDFVRLTPQYGGGGEFSFAGMDRRMNNITVDGSYFNNSFGLGGQPGDRTGVAPISMDAIEQIQVNIAPYDVRQGNFVGAGVNTVTRSGTNEFQGSIYHQWRNNQRALHGTQAGALKVDPGQFKYGEIGVNLGGPIIKDKLFFFASYENDALTAPATTFQACTAAALAANQCGKGNVTRVLQTDLDALSTFLQSKFNYSTGPYQGYDSQTPATRWLGKLDYNLNNANKLSLRYSQLDSYTDVLASTSSSLGAGARRSNTNALNFANSNYQILENIKSLVGEVNSVLGNNMSNNFILGYEYHDESRKYKTPCSSFSAPAPEPGCFPLVDIRQTGSTYTSFGFEPFTPNNELRYGSWQVQDNLTRYMGDHEVTLGVSGEKYHSENVFFPGAQSVYTYNSLADFYTDANDYLANPNRTVSPVQLGKFEVAWSNIPGQSKPIQPLDVLAIGVYGQDQWRLNDKVKLTFGLRLDRPSFGNTSLRNDSVEALTFRDENSNPVKYSTAKLPNANILFSPRFGFNWDVNGDKTFQVRGGTGVFSGRPPYVWISNQVGNNGILTGFERVTNTTSRPFNPDPNHYKPKTVTGAPASSYGLALTDPNFKFPQLWRTDIAVDKRLPWDLTGSAEFLFNRDVNGIYYINANLPAPDGNFTGVDKRPRWNVDKCPTQIINGQQQFTGNEVDRINCPVINAIVLKNGNKGYGWNVSASLERPFATGTFAKVAYNYGVAKSLVDPGFIAYGSWSGNAISGNPNTPPVAYAPTSPGHRVFLAVSQKLNVLKVGATTASLFWEWRTIGNGSYTFSGDLNGDGGFSNDLIYIARDTSEMNFAPFTSSGVTFTRQMQQQAWEKFIQQDKYLRSHRGKYAERNAVFMPMFNRADFSISQDVTGTFLKDRHTLQLRLDFLNFGNLLNHNWGVSQRFTTTQPLISRGADASGAVQYNLRNFGPNLISSSFQPTASIFDVYRIQLSVRYNFNQ